MYQLARRAIVSVIPINGNPIPESGQIVRVRSRQFLVDEVVLPPEPWHQTLVRMSCLDDDEHGSVSTYFGNRKLMQR
jgi:hypothetical protein